MKCVNKKMLKFKYVDNDRINLYNERQINVDNFNSSTQYDDSYKQKTMIFMKNNFKMILAIKTDSDKNTRYEIKIVFKSSEDERELEEYLKILE